MVSPLGARAMQPSAANPLAGRNQLTGMAGANRRSVAPAGNPAGLLAVPPALGGDSSQQMLLMVGLMGSMLAMMLMGLLSALGGKLPGGMGGTPLAASLSGGAMSGASPGGLGGTLGMPLQGVFRKTSDFGHRESPTGNGLGTEHTGIDLAAPMGEPILATADGVVGFAGERGDGFGNHVILSHGGGLESLYGHMSAIAVPPGAFVRQGQVIGYVGSTGYSTGPHLHFEMRRNGMPFDPDRLFPNLA